LFRFPSVSFRLPQKTKTNLTMQSGKYSNYRLYGTLGLCAAAMLFAIIGMGTKGWVQVRIS
jgi:hypothetical protein